MSFPRPEPTRPQPPQRIRKRTRVRRGLPVSEEVSAGGVCVRIDEGIAYVAVIARRNRSGSIEWCLPKGHIEAGETAIAAAEREVAEEAGVTGRAIRHLCSIDYWFSSPRTRIHKTVHHYLLEYLHGEVTAELDPDHEAEDAAWIPLKEARHILAYPNERRVIETALSLLYPEVP
ncbi:NUDIX hydrolase [Actinomycetaceae bacterium WB03_NA08]|uniref:NUDIX hydrolase n=1 Tax=Scrofimicrobium canadense TaxID=2652290 RepID=A0A6N7W7J8_9ACTO|nr:NUDIX hydrolase [Scrofimicrobium canadense]MSS85361.1 NUDIX hydrolase [Scrofimicrobium canadense]